jgi:hypothetical protein
MRTRTLIRLGHELTAHREANRPLLSSPRAGIKEPADHQNVEPYELPGTADKRVPALYREVT